MPIQHSLAINSHYISDFVSISLHFSFIYLNYEVFININDTYQIRRCGGHKKSSRTLSIVQIIFSFWSFEISEGILRNQKIIFGLDAFSNQRLLYLAPFRVY